MHVRHSAHLTGKFNAHLVNALLVFADEALYPGDKAGEGALKALITEPTTPLEYKGKDIVQVKNYIRIIMASNQSWVVPAAMDDRRFAVIEVSEARLQDHAYFAAIEAKMEAGGRAALLDYLLKLPLTENLRKIPETQARLDQQMLTLSSDPFLEFWLDRLTDNGWLEDEKTADIMRDYREVAGRYPLRETVFGTRLKKLFPTSRKVRLRNGDDGKRRTRYYQLPALAEARKDFEKTVGRQFNWDALSSQDEDRNEPI
jgi:phage/plasmid-associated DNA primase